MNKVLFAKENSNTKQSKSKRVTVVVTYHPLLKSFQSLINKYLNILYIDENAKVVFMPVPTFCGSRKLSSYLVRAKLYRLERVTGSCKCHGKRCAVGLNVNETSTFTSSVTLETYKTNHKFDCNSKCLIYYLDKNRKYQLSERCMQEHLLRHFSSQGHNGFLNDV